MHIDITEFFKAEDPGVYSGNAIEYGVNAGAITWANSMAGAKTYKHLDDDEKREAWRRWVEGSGGWTWEEIQAWTNDELEALFIQWVSGDMRECGLEGCFEDLDWEEYERRAQAGNCPSTIWKDDEGRVFFSLE